MKILKKGILFFLIACFVINCGQKINKEKILELARSEKPCDRIKAFLAIGNSEDTSLYYLFFENMRDMNITHCKDYFGKSVLWAKIETLRKITNIEPVLKYDFMRPDPRILEQYREMLFPH